MADASAALIDWDAQHAHVVGPVGDALVALAHASAEVRNDLSDPGHIHRAGLQLKVATTIALTTPESGVEAVDQPRRRAWEGLATAATLAQHVDVHPAADPRTRQISDLVKRASSLLQDATSAHDTALGRG